jgi:hypothetical protein
MLDLEKAVVASIDAVAFNLWRELRASPDWINPQNCGWN